MQVGSQVAKVSTGCLQPHVAPQLCKYAGPDQYADPALGTLKKWSRASVYLDLSKAFDMACPRDGAWMAWSC